MNFGLTVFCGYSCNMSCSYCYLKDKPNNTEINFTTLKNSLSSNRNIDTLTLIGGEPLLHKDFIDFLEFVWNENKTRINKISIIILTNGTIYLPQLKNYKDIITMQISIDGGEKTNNSRRVFKNDAYNITINNLKKYYNDGIKVSINSVIFDAKMWKKDVTQLVNDLPQDIAYGLNIEEFEKTSWIKDLYKIYIIISVEKMFRKKNKDFRFYFKYFGAEQSICNAGYSFLSVNLTDGNMAPCHVMFGDDKYKNEYVGFMDNKFNIDPDKLDKSLKFNNIKNYKINYIGKLSRFLFPIFSGPICYVNNKIITGDYFVIPLRHILFGIIIKLFRGKNV